MSYTNVIYLTTLEFEPDSVREWQAGRCPLGTRYVNQLGLDVVLFPSGGLVAGSDEARAFAKSMGM